MIQVGHLFRQKSCVDDIQMHVHPYFLKTTEVTVSLVISDGKRRTFQSFLEISPMPDYPHDMHRWTVNVFQVYISINSWVKEEMQNLYTLVWLRVVTTDSC